MTNVQKSVILSIVVFFLFSVADVCRKIALETMDIYIVQAYVTGTMTVMLLLCAPFLGGFKSMIRFEKPWIILLKSMLLPVIILTSAFGLFYLDLATFYTLIFISPVIVAVLARLYFHEPIKPHHMLVFAMGFAGVLVVLRPGFEVINIGAVMVLIGALAFALNSLTNKVFHESSPSLPLVFYPAFLSAVIFFAAAFPDIEVPDLQTGMLIAVSAASSGIAATLQIRAYQIAAANIPTPFHYTQLIWGVLFGYFLFGDVPGLWTWAGGTLIIGAGLFLYAVENNKKGYSIKC